MMNTLEKMYSTQSTALNASTFNTRTKKECFVCGKPGHLKKDCWHTEPNKNNRVDNKNKERSQQSHQRGYRGRGRGWGFQQNQTRGGQSRGQRNSDSSGAQAWATKVYNSEVKKYSENRENSNEINWPLDSGCSDHIVNDCKFFENYVNLKNHVDVELPDGKMLEATKIGNVKAYFKTYYYDENEINV